MVQPGDYAEPLFLLVGSLLVAALDVLVVVVLGGTISLIGCVGLGGAVGGALWCFEVWRRRRDVVLYLEECERARQQQAFLHEYLKRRP